MSYEQNGYDVLGASESVELTDLELNLILGGNEPGVDIREEPHSGGQLYQPQQNNPNGNALDLTGSHAGHTSSEGSSAPPPTPGPAHQMFTGMEQVTNNPQVQQVAHTVDSAVYYNAHVTADFVDVGSQSLATKVPAWAAPIVVYAGHQIAEAIRPEGPPP